MGNELSNVDYGILFIYKNFYLYLKRLHVYSRVRTDLRGIDYMVDWGLG